MARVKGGNVSKNRRRKVLKEAKGYFGSKHRLYKTAQEQTFHSGVYAFRDRKANKRNFRKLWITRINAACRENDISYSKFINGLNKAGIEINRKMLSEMAIDDAKSFASLVEVAKKALNGEKVKPVASIKTESQKEEVVKAKEEKEPVKKAQTTKKAPAKTSEKPASKKTTTAAKKTTTTKKTTTKKEN